MKSHVLMAGLFAAFTAHGAWAQVAPAPSAPAPSAHQLELSHEILNASGASANYDTMTTGMMRQVFAQASQGQTASSKQAMEAMEQAEEKVLAELKPKIFSVAETSYASTYTESEMKGILAFYQSPAGQAVIAKAPVLMKNVIGGVTALMPAIKSDFVKSYCESLKCTADQRQAMLTKMSTPHT